MKPTLPGLPAGRRAKRGIFRSVTLVAVFFLVTTVFFWQQNFTRGEEGRRMPLLSQPLPKYTGKFHVGTVDIEVPVEDERSIGNVVFRSDGKPALKVSNSFHPFTKNVSERICSWKRSFSLSIIRLLTYILYLKLNNTIIGFLVRSL